MIPKIESGIVARTRFAHEIHNMSCLVTRSSLKLLIKRAESDLDSTGYHSMEDKIAGECYCQEKCLCEIYRTTAASFGISLSMVKNSLLLDGWSKYMAWQSWNGSCQSAQWAKTRQQLDPDKNSFSFRALRRPLDNSQCRLCLEDCETLSEHITCIYLSCGRPHQVHIVWQNFYWALKTQKTPPPQKY